MSSRGKLYFWVVIACVFGGFALFSLVARGLDRERSEIVRESSREVYGLSKSLDSERKRVTELSQKLLELSFGSEDVDRLEIDLGVGLERRIRSQLARLPMQQGVIASLKLGRRGYELEMTLSRRFGIDCCRRIVEDLLKLQGVIDPRWITEIRASERGCPSIGLGSLGRLRVEGGAKKLFEGLRSKQRKVTRKIGR